MQTLGLNVVLVSSLMAATLGSAIVGCGGGGKDIPLDDLADALKDAVCSRSVRCGEYPDKATCAAATNPQMEQLKADVAAGKTKYDGKSAGSCLEVFTTPHGLGSCNFSEAVAATRPQSCRDTFKGTVATGGACFRDEECVSLSCDTAACAAAATCCAGACAPPAPVSVPVGGDCSEPDAECIPSAYCRTNAAGSTCGARTAAGQPCTDLEECVTGYFCDVDPAAPGTCGRFPTEGQPCRVGIFACDATNDFCDPTTLKCARKVAPGGACPTGVSCVSYASCDATQTCVTRPGAGGACPSATVCLGSLQCMTGTCTLPLPDAACQ